MRHLVSGLGDMGSGLGIRVWYLAAPASGQVLPLEAGQLLEQHRRQPLRHLRPGLWG
jgi:hypothetical protein